MNIPMVRQKPAHDLWEPSEGQFHAVEFMQTSAIVALWADPGAGKTSITLAAFVALKDASLVRDMLVVAPLRVCQLVWRQEAQKWTQFRHLKVVLLHGSKKDQLLRDGLSTGVDIFLINYEGLDWLCDKYYKRNLPFDVVCADEITKLKAHDSQRARKLRAVTAKTRYKWGLTGTPVPNGYMDLFGQFLWLDGGASLGKYITHFRDMYFKSDFTGWNYVLQAGGAERIEERVAPYVMRLAYDAMPLVPDVRWLEMSAADTKRYREMKREMLVELPEGTVTAANAAAVQQKLSQMANGAVYYVDDQGVRRWAHLHDTKLDALEELIEEMNGQQLFIAYEFGHDEERILKRFPQIVKLEGSGAKLQQIEDDWNAGKIQLIMGHPASVGHGLNMQKSSASHICWFSATWNLEHWDQLIRRLRRQGSKATHIVNHVLAVRGTIDELKIEALDGKDVTQARLLHPKLWQILSEDTHAGSTLQARNGERGTSREVAGVRDSHSREDTESADGGSGDRGGDVPERPEPAQRSADGGEAVRRERDTQESGGDRLSPNHVGPEPDARQTQPGGLNLAGFRLPQKKDPAPAAEEAATARPVMKGWPGKGGAVQAAVDPAPVAATPQREAIRARVTPVRPVAQPEPVTTEAEDDHVAAPATARGMFSRTVQAALEHPHTEHIVLGGEVVEVDVSQPETPKPRASRSRKTDIAPAAEITKDEQTSSTYPTAPIPCWPNFSVHLNGLPPAAIKAALQAIVDNL